DVDLNYSAPSAVVLTVVPLWYLNPRIAGPAGGAVVALLALSLFSTTRYRAKRREALRLRERLLEEEHRARETLEAKNVQLARAKESAEAAREQAESANAAKSEFL